jgi:hypothetical protein
MSLVIDIAAKPFKSDVASLNKVIFVGYAQS